MFCHQRSQWRPCKQKKAIRRFAICKGLSGSEKRGGSQLGDHVGAKGCLRSGWTDVDLYASFSTGFFLDFSLNTVVVQSHF